MVFTTIWHYLRITAIVILGARLLPFCYSAKRAPICHFVILWNTRLYILLSARGACLFTVCHFEERKRRGTTD